MNVSITVIFEGIIFFWYYVSSLDKFHAVKIYHLYIEYQLIVDNH